MVRSLVVIFVCASSLVVGAFCQTNTPSPDERDTVCSFANGQQLSIRYSDVSAAKTSELSPEKAGTPGDRPIYLFSETPLQVGTTAVPSGAYSLFFIPGPQNWKVIINRGVAKGQPYDPTKDVARIDAPTEKLPSAAAHLNLYFGHVAPKTCNLRIDYGKQRAVAEFTQK